MEVTNFTREDLKEDLIETIKVIEYFLYGCGLCCAYCGALIVTKCGSCEYSTYCQALGCSDCMGCKTF